MTEKRKQQNDRTVDGRFVRAWVEGRGRSQEVMVQIWNCGKPDGEPDGDWAMPGILGLNLSIQQALIQTPKPKAGRSGK